MEICTSIQLVRETVDRWRHAKQSLAFVPTMGNLHAGHLSLVKKAKAIAAKTAVSIYVNPLQFGPSEDLGAYPRTLQMDQKKLNDAGVDLLFIPIDQEMYPVGRPDLTFVEVPSLSDILCGASRPGHFAGVMTVVIKLFNIVQPNFAVFGEKDFQQLFLLKKMVRDLNIPIKIVTMPTSREDSGLALSSRNQYLSDEQKKVAAGLYKTLCWMREQFQQNAYTSRQQVLALEQQGLLRLEQQGFVPEYLSIRNSDTFVPVSSFKHQNSVVLIAAMLGQTRLIDNLSLD